MRSMSDSLNLSCVAELPQQRSFLQNVIPVLADIESIQAIWLVGSLARGDADRWSSVDLCLLWNASASDALADVSSQCEALRAALSRALGDGCYLLDQVSERVGGGSLQGITLTSTVPIERRGSGDGAVEGCVGFSIDWAAVSAMARTLRSWHGLAQPLFIADCLPDDLRRYLQGKFATLNPPAADVVDAHLGRFWSLLARLPAVVKRREDLAAHALLTELRTVLIDLVVALNGASRPQSPARINQYLGAAQQAAFEKTLGNDKARWIGQAVALIVLYRWYAPQLAEIYSLPYPHRAEQTVLAWLRAEIDGWPAQITTG